MNKIAIEFTKEEANALVQLLDIAQKTQGLPVSKSCIYFFEKFNEAFKDEVEEPAELEEEKV